jgi:teichoic acid transport system permease protein
MVLNPLYPMIGGWSELLRGDEIPQVSWWVAGTLWAVAAFVAGSLFFMSREREFAVRL